MSTMLTIHPSETKIPELHQYLLGAVSPRPIAFVSTMDAAGNANLAPFSFFTAIGSNPAMVVFSPALSGRDAKTKNTLENILETKEAVVNIVNYGMVQQVSLASSPYAKGINEFEKTGLTPLASKIVKPFRVKESNIHLECKVQDVIKTGDKGGAGNIVIAEIVLIHINKDVLDPDGRINPVEMDYIARMGGNYYCRVIPESIFELVQPKDTCGMGVDALPKSVRRSHILTGNHLGALGNLAEHPSSGQVAVFKEEHPALIEKAEKDGLHEVAAMLLNENRVWEAFCLLMTEHH